MINLADRITAKTVENILTDSTEIAYEYGTENAGYSGDTVAGCLNTLNEKIVEKVTLGEIVGNVEKYVVHNP